MDEKYYIGRLQEILGMPEKEARQFVKSYLTMLWDKGLNVPGINGRVGDLTLFGGIFYQIRMGGHPVLTPSGQNINMILVASEKGVYKNSEGRDAWKVYMLCPELKLGPLVAAYRDCETEELEILFGLDSPDGPATAESTLRSLIRSEIEQKEEAH